MEALDFIQDKRTGFVVLLNPQGITPSKVGRPSGCASDLRGEGAGRPSWKMRGISLARLLVEQSNAAAMKWTSCNCSDKLVWRLSSARSCPGSSSQSTVMHCQPHAMNALVSGAPGPAMRSAMSGCAERGNEFTPEEGAAPSPGGFQPPLFAEVQAAAPWLKAPQTRLARSTAPQRCAPLGQFLALQLPCWNWAQSLVPSFMATATAFPWIGLPNWSWDVLGEVGFWGLFREAALGEGPAAALLAGVLVVLGNQWASRAVKTSWMIWPKVDVESRNFATHSLRSSKSRAWSQGSRAAGGSIAELRLARKKYLNTTSKGTCTNLVVSAPRLSSCAASGAPVTPAHPAMA
eukprot:s702_g57.t1